MYLTQRERSQVGREAGRESGGSRLPAEQRARCRARSQDLGIMTRAKGRGLNTLSHPGAPIKGKIFFKTKVIAIHTRTHAYTNQIKKNLIKALLYAAKC